MIRTTDLAAAIAAWLAVAPAWAESLVVPFPDGFPPLSSQNAAGEPEGYDIAVAQALAAILQDEVSFVEEDFDVIQSGDWPEDWHFAVSSMSQTAERAESFDYVGPYYYDRIVVLSHKATAGDDPAGYQIGNARIGVCRGCIYRAYIEGSFNGQTPPQPPYPGLEIVDYLSDTQMLLDLSLPPETAPITLGITSQLVAQFLINEDAPIVPVGSPAFVEPLWIVLPRGRDELRDRIDAALQSIRSDGTLRALSVDYLGADFTE